MSYTFRGNDDYTSIPGLIEILDTRFRVTPDADGGSRLRWSGLQDFLVNFYNSSGPQKPNYLSDNQIEFENDAGTQRKVLFNDLLGDKNLDFLVSGLFGIYFILKLDTTVTSSSFPIVLSTVSGGPSYMTLRIDSNSNFKFQMRNDVPATVDVFTKTSFIPDDTYFSLGVFRDHLTDANNFTLSKNEVIDSVASNIVTNLNSIKGIRLGGQETNANTRRCTFGKIILYNWTGFSKAEIAGFDSKVRGVLAPDRLIFAGL